MDTTRLLCIQILSCYKTSMHQKLLQIWKSMLLLVELPYVAVVTFFVLKQRK